MPSIVFDPKRLPSKEEARAIAERLKTNVHYDPDATSEDYLVIHLLDAYAKGEVARIA